MLEQALFTCTFSKEQLIKTSGSPQLHKCKAGLGLSDSGHHYQVVVHIWIAWPCCVCNYIDSCMYIGVGCWGVLLVPKDTIKCNARGVCPNFQRFSPKLKVTTFLRRPAKLVCLQTVKNTPDHNGPGQAESQRVLHLSSQPSPFWASQASAPMTAGDLFGGNVTLLFGGLDFPTALLVV